MKNENPKVYVGTWFKYNNGNIGGKWIDITQFATYEDFIAECKKIHSDEKDPEFMVQDYECFPDGFSCKDWLYEDDFNEILAVKSAENNDFQIIDYSDKAIAVIGDTKRIKEQLKSLGGRFNPKLSCGCGWVFSKTKLQEVKEVLNLDVVEEKSKETTNDYKKLLDSLELIDGDYYKKHNVGAIIIDGYPFLISKPSIKTDFCFHDEGPDYEHYKDVTKDNKSLKEHFLSENFRDFDWRLKKLKDETSFIYKELCNYSKTISIRFDCYGLEREKLKGKEITKEQRDELIKALEYGKKCLEKRLQTYLKKYGTSKIKTWTYWADR